MTELVLRRREILPVDEDELVACVACGLCLPHCPTYRVTGEEVASPRGRIAAMREVHWQGAEPDAAFVRFMDACVQCRGCETACPSSVPFGRLMEGTRDSLAAAGRFTPWWQRLGMKALGHHRLVLAGSRMLGAAQRAHVVPKRVEVKLGVADLPVRVEPLRATGDDVWLFTGCVMDAWLRHVHAAAIRVLGRAGVGVALPGRGGDCCGALHLHAGLTDDTKRLAERVMGSMPGDAPILVDSAGCGAVMKDYGHVLNTPEARAFSARVFDIHEWLATRMDALPQPASPSAVRVAVQDPCHLRHVQRAHLPVRTVLAPYVQVVELDDEGLCCGAGGAYAALHPEMASAIRARKMEAIGRADPDVVASANPGCALHLAAAGAPVLHPMQIVDGALDGR
ncbi:MAG TPA: (Fe-S)-binding protein [Acidimicrobiales bacterium]|nr:(Fe-S)-binding protein [Acidimicrobiales bacterium]